MADFNRITFRRWLPAFLVGCIGLIGSCRSNFPPPAATNVTSDNCYSVAHLLGETCVPDPAKRVIILTKLDTPLALGVKPVGAAFRGSFRTRAGEFEAYLAEQTQGIEKVGLGKSPSIEGILALKPDLIVGNQQHQAIYDQLSQIAPTVLIETKAGGDWKTRLMRYGEIFNKTDEAEQLLADYDQRVAALQQAITTETANLNVSLLRFRPDLVRIYLPPSFAASILQDVGFSGPSFKASDRPYEQLSLETLPTSNADLIFFFQDDPEDSFIAKAADLWNQLEAVKSGQVYEVPFEIWYLGSGIQAANLVLDDLYKQFDVTQSE